MNFLDLYTRIKSIDEGQEVSDEQDLQQEEMTDECGMSMSPSMPPKQSDSVTMNVSMNGSGAGGIKDLMDILKNIETKTDHDHKEPLTGEPFDEELANDPEEVTLGIDAVTNTGMPINAGDHRDDRQAGPLPVGNPIDESLVNRLSQMYNEIKSSN